MLKSKFLTILVIIKYPSKYLLHQFVQINFNEFLFVINKREKLSSRQGRAS